MTKPVKFVIYNTTKQETEGEVTVENGKLPDLKYKNLDEAKTHFIESVKNYQIYYRENPDAEHLHFVFGTLNKEMMELFHQKHVTHHFEQFGLA